MYSLIMLNLQGKLLALTHSELSSEEVIAQNILKPGYVEGLIDVNFIKIIKDPTVSRKIAIKL